MFFISAGAREACARGAVNRVCAIELQSALLWCLRTDHSRFLITDSLMLMSNFPERVSVYWVCFYSLLSLDWPPCWSLFSECDSDVNWRIIMFINLNVEERSETTHLVSWWWWWANSIFTWLLSEYTEAFKQVLLSVFGAAFIGSAGGMVLRWCLHTRGPRTDTRSTHW